MVEVNLTVTLVIMKFTGIVVLNHVAGVKVLKNFIQIVGKKNTKQTLKNIKKNILFSLNTQENKVNM